MATPTVDELQDAIAKLTNRRPMSRDPDYLTRRLADLKTMKKQGEPTKRARKEAHTVISVSLPISAKQAMIDIIDAEKLHGASQLVRLALREWCDRNGHKPKADLFAVDEES